MQRSDQTFHFGGRTWTTGEVHFPFYCARTPQGDCLMIIFERSPEINGTRMDNLYQEEFEGLFAELAADPASLAIFERSLYGPNNPKPDPFPFLDRVSANTVSHLLGIVRTSRAINAQEFVENLTATIGAHNAKQNPLMVMREMAARKILAEEPVARVLQDQYASLDELLRSLEELRSDLWDAEDEEFAD